MQADVLYVLPTAVDLLALVICLGALGCRLWILPAVEANAGADGVDAILIALWRVLLICLTVLTISSLGELFGRAAEMSSMAFPKVLPLLPTILFHTHYGWVWMLRLLGLAGLWVGCLGRWHRQPRIIPVLMLAAGALVAATRSASGHGRRWGRSVLR